MRAIICCGKYNARYISSKLRDHVNNAIKFSKIQYNRTRLYPESDNWCKIPVKYEILTISRYRGIYNAKYQQKWTRIFENALFQRITILFSRRWISPSLSRIALTH